MSNALKPIYKIENAKNFKKYPAFNEKIKKGLHEYKLGISSNIHIYIPDAVKLSAEYRICHITAKEDTLIVKEHNDNNEKFSKYYNLLEQYLKDNKFEKTNNCFIVNSNNIDIFIKNIKSVVEKDTLPHRFQNVVVDIFNKQKYKIEYLVEKDHGGIDFLFKNKNYTGAATIKFYKSIASFDLIKNACFMMEKYKHENTNIKIFVLVISNEISDAEKKEIKKLFNVIVIDRASLFQLTSENIENYSKLEKVLIDSMILPKEIILEKDKIQNDKSIKLEDLFNKENESSCNEKEVNKRKEGKSDYIEKLLKIPAGKSGWRNLKENV